MESNYYEKLHKEIQKKIKALEKGNFFEFYKESNELSIALSLAYYVLIVEKLIFVDKKNSDLESRYRLSCDYEIIDELFEAKDEIFKNITKKEEKGNNIWFLVALRNALLHNGIREINVEQGSIYIESSHELNVLQGSIPISFFRNFMNKISDKNLPKNLFLTQIEDFKENYIENSTYLNELLKYISPEYLEKVLKTTGDRSIQLIMKRIHEMRQEKGEKASYSKALTIKVGYHCDISGIKNEEDRHIAWRIRNFVHEHDDYTLEEVVFILKKKYPDFYQKYNNDFFEGSKYFSDEDMEICNRIYDSNRISEFRQQASSKYNKSKMLTSLLYIFGINMYVMNKETFFDNSEDLEDYSFMEGLNIRMYSYASMKKRETLCVKKDSLEKEVRRLQKKYDKFSKNPKFPIEKLNEIKKSIEQIKEQIDSINKQIEHLEVKEIKGRKMALEDNNSEKARTIRNCLSHIGRIKIVKNGFLDKLYRRHITTLLLIDRNETGPAATVECSLDELLRFIKYDGMKKVMIESPRPNNEDFEGTISYDQIVDRKNKVNPLDLTLDSNKKVYE